MVVDYEDSQRASELEDRAREFVENEAIPVEREHQGQGPVSWDVIEDLQEKAKEYDIYCPQIDEEHGGMGEDFRDVLPLFEQAGRCLLAPMAMRVDAPDEGNMHTLELVGTEEQKERFLDPLVESEIRSGFSMTEPMAGAGSDPKMMKTTAEKDGDEWVINGHKWWTTQGDEADILLVMARTDMDAHPYEGTSIIVVPSDADGVEIVESTPHIGQDLIPEGHAEIRYDNVRVPEENLLGAENAGFAIAQQRLGPARLTHCMRFSGMASRALGIAKEYMQERDAFGDSLSDKQSQRFRIAEQETQLHAARTMVRHAAEKISQGEEARIEVAMSKYYTANVVQETIDLALQSCGGSGISKHLPIADFYEANRAFRIVDGADEVHKRSIARAAFEDVPEGELENLPRF
ncbi:acyl-CoA dehydrogenase family protein [Halorientalis marina]|uniref:acyl-CoA dehydrogenase family protein n=1 Tax=Halorientalis marina TaxID=2931976 RepID=UPI001FF17AE9|nr:acyl-CoA dehydrogenase family protein [Halorientalis marina]